MTVSDLVAQFFAEKGLTHAFGIVGAGNMRIFDAIHKLGKTQIVCTHHEQAAAQASIGYYRASGKIAPVLVTCGGGASNVVTGIVSAWMDSIPLFVIAGQESIRNEKLRAYGVQGFSLVRMVFDVTKDRTVFIGPEKAKHFLSFAYSEMLERRPSPVVIEIPMDVQGMQA